MSADRHSRSVAAGYSPATLHAARVTLAGLGALGGNVLQDLALSGIGNLILIDFDTFEPHNSTLTPYYPDSEEQEWFGLVKAPTVAHRAAMAATAADPRVYYSTNMVQQAGDGVLSWADIVISAVDSVSARAWLAERCRLLGKPLIEGGFGGSEFNFSAFAGRAGEVCYRCFNPERTSSASCTQYAREAEAASIIPAIQTTAATLGGYMAELVIQLLHGEDNEVFGKRFYGSLHRRTLDASTLPVHPECPGKHGPMETIATATLNNSATLGDLVERVSEQVGPGWFELSEPLLIRQACTRCGNICDVGATESVWLRSPLCHQCSGPWSVSTSASACRTQLFRSSTLEPAAAETPLTAIGLPPGGSVIYKSELGPTGLITRQGDPLQSLTRARAR